VPAVALAEAPHPTVEPLAPSVTSLEPSSAAPQISAPVADPAREESPAAPEPVQPAPLAAAAPEASAEAKHTHHHHRSSKRDDDEGSRASSKSHDASVSHGKVTSANAKSSTKSTPADKGSDKAALFAAARDEARNAYAAKNYKDAAAAYERAAKYDPKHAGTFAGLGAARLQLGDNKAAVQAYQRAVQLAPETSGFHAALGRAYLALGDKSKALGAYKKALAIDPKNEAAKTAIKQLGG
jgi:cytochrome c-type biogenesis protein CcmH/NrfG